MLKISDVDMAGGDAHLILQFYIQIPGKQAYQGMCMWMMMTKILTNVTKIHQEQEYMKALLLSAGKNDKNKHYLNI